MGFLIQTDLSKPASPNQWGVVSRWTEFARSVLVCECLHQVLRGSWYRGLLDYEIGVDEHLSLIQQCRPGALWQVCNSSHPAETCSGILHRYPGAAGSTWASLHLLHVWVPRYITQPVLLGGVGQSDLVCMCCTDNLDVIKSRGSSAWCIATQKSSGALV